ncbi:hypothetical protein DFH06DRAFT_1408017 [Mycena polygramma]|nr:hypothetical protein DFH06DRAFT_1408017 [Mycena polygramma]
MAALAKRTEAHLPFSAIGGSAMFGDFRLSALGFDFPRRCSPKAQRSAGNCHFVHEYWTPYPRNDHVRAFKRKTDTDAGERVNGGHPALGAELSRDLPQKLGSGEQSLKNYSSATTASLHPGIQLGKAEKSRVSHFRSFLPLPSLSANPSSQLEPQVLHAPYDHRPPPGTDQLQPLPVAVFQDSSAPAARCLAPRVYASLEMSLRRARSPRPRSDAPRRLSVPRAHVHRHRQRARPHTSARVENTTLVRSSTRRVRPLCLPSELRLAVLQRCLVALATTPLLASHPPHKVAAEMWPGVGCASGHSPKLHAARWIPLSLAIRDSRTLPQQSAKAQSPGQPSYALSSPSAEVLPERTIANTSSRTPARESSGSGALHLPSGHSPSCACSSALPRIPRALWPYGWDLDVVLLLNAFVAAIPCVTARGRGALRANEIYADQLEARRLSVRPSERASPPRCPSPRAHYDALRATNARIPDHPLFSFLIHGLPHHARRPRDLRALDAGEVGMLPEVWDLHWVLPSSKCIPPGALVATLAMQSLHARCARAAGRRKLVSPTANTTLTLSLSSDPAPAHPGSALSAAPALRNSTLPSAAASALDFQLPALPPRMPCLAVPILVSLVLQARAAHPPDRVLPAARAIRRLIAPIRTGTYVWLGARPF